MIEIVRMAMGEQLQYPKIHIKWAWDIIAIITYQLIISVIQTIFSLSGLVMIKIWVHSHQKISFY